MKHLMLCSGCGKYTLKEMCLCGGKTLNPRPPKYSPQDIYAEYRRKAKNLVG